MLKGRDFVLPIKGYKTYRKEKTSKNIKSKGFIKDKKLILSQIKPLIEIKPRMVWNTFHPFFSKNQRFLAFRAEL